MCIPKKNQTIFSPSPQPAPSVSAHDSDRTGVTNFHTLNAIDTALLRHADGIDNPNRPILTATHDERLQNQNRPDLYSGAKVVVNLVVNHLLLTLIHHLITNLFNTLLIDTLHYLIMIL